MFKGKTPKIIMLILMALLLSSCGLLDPVQQEEIEEPFQFMPDGIDFLPNGDAIVIDGQNQILLLKDEVDKYMDIIDDNYRNQTLIRYALSLFKNNYDSMAAFRDVYVDPLKGATVAVVEEEKPKEVKKETKKIERDTEIPFEIVETKSSDLWSGTKEVLVEGIVGVKKTIVIESYEDGELVSSVVESETITKAPTKEESVIGVKVGLDDQASKTAFNLINSQRQSIGLSGIVFSDKIMSMTNKRAEEISQSYSGTRPDGSNWSTVDPNNQLTNEFNVSDASTAESAIAALMNNAEVKKILMSDANITGAISMYHNDKGVRVWNLLISVEVPEEVIPDVPVVPEEDDVLDDNINSEEENVEEVEGEN